MGQKGTVNILRARVQRGEAFSTSYLFSGYPGTGKTTLARVFALSVFCLNRDSLTQNPCLKCDHCLQILADSFPGFSERDAATQGSVDIIRGILEDIPYVLPGVPCRICLFDEAHMLSTAAQNALLKSCEEKKLVLVLCTTEANKIVGPIRTRCEEHVLRKPSVEDVLRRVTWILDQEGVEYDPQAVQVLVKHYDGLVRETLNRIETVSRLGRITMESALDSLGLQDLPLYYEYLRQSVTNPQECLATLERLLQMVSPDVVAKNTSKVLLSCYKNSLGVPTYDAVFNEELASGVVSDLGPARLISWARTLSRVKYESPTSYLTDFFFLSQSPVVHAAPPSPSVVTSFSSSNSLPPPPARPPAQTPQGVEGSSLVVSSYLDNDLDRYAMDGFKPPKRSAKAVQKGKPQESNHALKSGVNSSTNQGALDLKEPLSLAQWKEFFFQVFPPPTPPAL